ncbi:hypothetical protein I79_001904 [Cricetulus griseus]|uniref:Uncharacterized protein n=1 Tax=Cricetulus griseus TaxID=10029 RepID=G3GVZ8_CRIGR|nr:hypothetical protein I79_001904 [Cricetulus griseus]
MLKFKAITHLSLLPALPPEVFAKLIFIQSVSKGESRLLATRRDPEPESLMHLI